MSDLLPKLELTSCHHEETQGKEVGGRMGACRAHGAHYEEEFMQDMDRLGCLHPQVLTRVSEHMPEIKAYVEKIVHNGLAYVSHGSVYFDTVAFRYHPRCSAGTYILHCPLFIHIRKYACTATVKSSFGLLQG